MTWLNEKFGVQATKCWIVWRQNKMDSGHEAKNNQRVNGATKKLKKYCAMMQIKLRVDSKAKSSLGSVNTHFECKVSFPISRSVFE